MRREPNWLERKEVITQAISEVDRSWHHLANYIRLSFWQPDDNFPVEYDRLRQEWKSARLRLDVLLRRWYPEATRRWRD